jgi:hypothetical protein
LKKMHKISEKMAEKSGTCFREFVWRSRNPRNIFESIPENLSTKICLHIWVSFVEMTSAAGATHRSFQQMKPKYAKNFGEKFSGTDSKMCSRILWTSKNPRTQEIQKKLLIGK